jgi:hypothetical protein
VSTEPDPTNVVAGARDAIAEGRGLYEAWRAAELVGADLMFEARRRWHLWFDSHGGDLLTIADAACCLERIQAEWDASFRALRAHERTGDATREHLAALFRPDRDTQNTRIQAALASIGARHAGAL